MRFHRQPTQFDTYKLVVGKGGPKLRETTFTSEDLKLRPPHTDPDGTNFLAGLISTRPGNGRLAMAGGKMTIGNLANYLERALGGPVIDATGLTGEYDIRLEFSGEGILLPSARSLSSLNSPNTPSDPAPTLFQALDQGLGLKLEKSKAILDVIVVDHMNEVPTEN